MSPLGVSEGQFSSVSEVEVPLIRRAFRDVVLSPVRMILMIVQKRHNTRFALAEQNTQARKPTYNVPSGTVVDKGIVDPQLKCFYLNSHFSPLVSLIARSCLYSFTNLTFIVAGHIKTYQIYSPRGRTSTFSG